MLSRVVVLERKFNGRGWQHQDGAWFKPAGPIRNRSCLYEVVLDGDADQ